MSKKKSNKITLKRREVWSLLSQIKRGDEGLGKLVKSELDSEIKLSVYKLTRQISDSDTAKALEDYNQQMAQEIQSGEKDYQSAEAEFQKLLKEDCELDVEKLTISPDKLPTDFTVADMMSCDIVINFEGLN